jgi:ribonuclease HI
MPNPLDPHALHIFTDGSCLENPGGRGGVAAFVEYPDHLNLAMEQIVDFGCAETSNNRMELIAVLKSLNADELFFVRINQTTDSLGGIIYESVVYRHLLHFLWC